MIPNQINFMLHMKTLVQMVNSVEIVTDFGTA